MQREGLELFPLVAFVKNAPIRAEKHTEFLFWEKKRKKKKVPNPTQLFRYFNIRHRVQVLTGKILWGTGNAWTIIA